jgi:hypothetical protein
MRGFDRRFLVLLLVLSAVWWTFTLARGCQGGKPRPAELIPASGRDSDDAPGPGNGHTEPRPGTSPPNE